VDGIPGEAWRYGSEEVEEWMWKFCNDMEKEVTREKGENCDSDFKEGRRGENEGL